MRKFKWNHGNLGKSGFLVWGTFALGMGNLSHAGTVSFDGDGTGSITLATPNNWDTNTTPVTTDQAVFTDAAFGGSLPASLTNGSGQTWGNLVWNSNSSTAFSGSAIILSGLGGNVNGDLITVGSNATSATVTMGFTTGTNLYTGASGNLNVVNSGSALMISQQANMSTGTITKTGAGTVTYSNGNNAGGGASAKYVLDGGTLNLNSAAGFGGGATTTLEIHAGTFLDNTTGAGITVTRNFLQTWTGDFSFKGTGQTLNLGTGAVTMTGSRQITSFTSGRAFAVGGAIGDGGNGYGLTKVGAGNLQLEAANTYTGGTASYGGTTTLAFNATAAPTSNILSSGSTLVLGATTFSLTGKASTANTQTLGGVTVKAGSTQFTATSGATGGSMNVTLGTLSRQSGSTLNFTLPTTGAIALSNSNDAGGLIGPGILVGGNDWATVSGGNVAAFTGYTLQNAVGSWGANQNITNSAALTGTLGANLSINTLRFNAAVVSTANLGTNTLTALDGILLTGTVASSATTISNGFLQGSSGGELIVINNSTGALLTISARVIDNGSATAFVKSGNQQATLSNGANSYTGATYVNAGTLSAGAANVFGSNSAVVVSQGATLGLANFNQGIGSLASNPAATTGTVSLGTGTLTTGGNNTSTSFVGVISGGGSVVKTGSGTQKFSGASTYSGGTTVSGGALLVNNTTGSGTGTGTVLVQSTATLGGGNGAAFSGSASTQGSATLTNYAAGVVGIISGATTVDSGGHLAPGNSVGTLTLATLTLNSGSVLDYEFNLASNDLTAVTGAGGLTLGSVGLNLYQEGTLTAFATAGLYNIFDYNTSFTGSLAALTVLNQDAGYSYTFVNDTTDTLIQLQVTAVPEPSTYALLGMGLGALWIFRRKKKV